MNPFDVEEKIRQLTEQNKILNQNVATLNNAQKILLNEVVKTFARLDIIPNKIVFSNFYWQGYGDNLKYIAQEILRQNLPYDLVWCVKDMNTPLPAKIRKVLNQSVDFMYELATAKIIINNELDVLPFIKKFGQYYIMTWHGNFALKCVNVEMPNVTPQFVEYLKSRVALIDLMLGDSKQSVDWIRNAFLYRGNILNCGLPRTDILFNNSAEIVSQLKKQFKIPAGIKILLYAPTFRQDPKNFQLTNSFDEYTFDINKLLSVLNKKFGGQWVILGRFHPAFAATNFGKNLFKSSQNIFDVTNYPDVQELVLISDALLTDYSSIAYDFMVIKKPVFFLAKDLQTYKENRGLKPIYFNMPYRINETEKDLFDCIKNYNESAANSKVDKLLKELKPVVDGNASEEI